MPTLKRLLQELRILQVKPDEVRIPRRVFDDVVDQAEEASDAQDQED